MPLAVVQIKSSANVTERDVASLSRFAPDFKGAEIICLSQNSRPKIIGPVDIEPWEQGIRRILRLADLVITSSYKGRTQQIIKGRKFNTVALV